LLHTNKKLPLFLGGVSYFVETRGIDTPRKDGVVGGLVEFSDYFSDYSCLNLEAPR
jgi:hypothetical protein